LQVGCRLTILPPDVEPDRIGPLVAAGEVDAVVIAAGDAANVIPVGHNLRLVLAWLRILLRLILIALGRSSPSRR
jgi:hypothetical protein